MEIQLYEALRLSLDPISGNRTAAEARLKEFELDPNYSSALVKIAASSEIYEDIRQTSLYILKAYVDSNWNLGCEKYIHGPVASQQSKQIVREAIFQVFSDKSSKLRKAAAYVLSTIGRYDWPEEWPQMFQLLLNLIKNGNPDQVTSAMMVFKEIITRDLSSDQLQELGLLLPEFRNILDHEDAFSVETRTIAVQIFAESVELLSILEFETIDNRVEVVKTMLATWIQKLVEILSSKTTLQSVDDLVIKYSAVKALKNLSIAFSKHFHPYYEQIINTIWSELQNLLGEYKKQYIAPPDPNSDSQVWVSSFLLDDSTSVDLSNYISILFEYTSVNTRHQLAKTIFTHSSQKPSDTDLGTLVNMMSITIEYAQVSQEMADLWSSDIEQLVNDEEEYSANYSVRQAAKEFAQTISEYFALEYTESLSNAIQLTVTRNSDNHFSKGLVNESALYILETTSGIITNVLFSDTTNSPNLSELKSLIVNLTAQNIQIPLEVFSFARAFIVAAIYSKLVPKDVITDLIKASIDISKVATANSGLVELFSHQVVQVFSLMACSKFIMTASPEIIKPLCPEIILKATRTANQLGYETLFIALECILHVLKVDESLKEQFEPTIGPLLVVAWVEFGKDPVLENLIIDLIAEMSKNPLCFIALFTRFIPVIKEIFDQKNSEKVPLAIDILSAIMQGSGRAEIPKECIESIYPQLMNILLTSDDSTVAQSGQECVKYMIQNGLRHIVANHSEQLNVSGLQLLFRFIGDTLSLDSSESSALFIGDLISKLIIKGEKINAINSDTLAELVYLIIRKLAVARSTVFSSSLLPSICLLVIRSASQVIELLNGIEVQDSFGTKKTGLQAFLERWVECAPDIQGVYFTKVSTMAMINVVLLSDSRVNSTLVNGDPIENSSSSSIRFSLRSRAKAKPLSYTQIPAPVKIVKLLLEEYSTNLEYKDENLSILGKPINSSRHNQNDDSDGSWDEENFDEYDMSVIAGKANDEYDFYGNLNDLAKYGKDSGSDEEEDNDPDILNSPIYSLNMNSQIKQFIKRCEQTNESFGATIKGFLTSPEQSILKDLLTK